MHKDIRKRSCAYACTYFILVDSRRTGRVRSSCAFAYVMGVLACFSVVYAYALRCSQNAPLSVRRACYSFVGTLEILGKQLPPVTVSLFRAVVLSESFGYVAGLNVYH